MYFSRYVILLYLACLFVSARSDYIRETMRKPNEVNVPPEDAEHNRAGDDVSNHHRVKKAILDDSIKTYIVTVINNRRRSVNASNMLYTRWDASLGTYANTIASSCNTKYMSTVSGYPDMGIFTGIQLTGISYSSYDGQNSFYDMLVDSSNLLNITHSETNIVACASQFCPTLYSGSTVRGTYKYFYFCLFPYIDKSSVYSTVGTPCSGCSTWGRNYWCDNGLCRDDCNNVANCDQCSTDCKFCNYVLSDSCPCQCAYQSYGVPCNNTAQGDSSLPVCGSTTLPDVSSTIGVVEGKSIENKMNYLRGDEGASNMLYTKWSAGLADLAAKWVYYCNYSRPSDQFDSSILIDFGYRNYYFIRGYRTTSYNAAQDVLATLYSDINQRKYILGYDIAIIGCDIKYCPVITTSTISASGYLIGCILPTNQISPSYNRGQPCQDCGSFWNRNYWCSQGGLCRDDCDDSSTCSHCLSDCTACSYVLSNTCPCKCAYQNHGIKCDANATGFQSLPTCTTPVSSTVTTSTAVPINLNDASSRRPVGSVGAGRAATMIDLDFRRIFVIGVVSLWRLRTIWE